MSALVDQGPLADTSTSQLDLSEETANQLTHGLGLLLSLVGAAVLVNSARAHSDPLQFVGCCVYAVSLVSLYAASTLSHSFRTPPMRHVYAARLSRPSVRHACAARGVGCDDAVFH